MRCLFASLLMSPICEDPKKRHKIETKPLTKKIFFSGQCRWSRFALRMYFQPEIHYLGFETLMWHQNKLDKQYLEQESVKKRGYFTVRLTVRVDPPPLRSVFLDFY